MENEKFVTVLTSAYMYEIAIVQGRLEAESITCFVKDEFIIQIHPFYSNAVGGIKLQVKESDLNQAIEILKEPGYTKEEELQLLQEFSCLHKNNDDQQILIKKKKIICPICGSEEVVQSKKMRWLSLFALLLITIPAPFFQKTYYCFDCKQEVKKHKNKYGNDRFIGS